MKILFHENELNYRGTSIALFDYARFNEELLGNESIIIYNKTKNTNHELGIKKFEDRFKVIGYTDPKEIESHLKENQIDLLYMIKRGVNDGIDTDFCKSAVHTTFKFFEPHGDVYAYVSKWLSNEMTDGKRPYVPHMVDFQNPTIETLHDELNIDKKNRVFGYYGGSNSFNVPFVQKMIKKLAKKYKDVTFIFMGVDNFTSKNWWSKQYPNIKFLSPTGDVDRKIRFINTCDALLHARQRGETFGITVAEFAILGKPVIAYGDVPEKAHIDQMGDLGYYYTSPEELESLLMETNLEKTPMENYMEFLPAEVMKKFQDVFIKS